MIVNELLVIAVLEFEGEKTCICTTYANNEMNNPRMEFKDIDPSNIKDRVARQIGVIAVEKLFINLLKGKSSDNVSLTTFFNFNNNEAIYEKSIKISKVSIENGMYHKIEHDVVKFIQEMYEEYVEAK